MNRAFVNDAQGNALYINQAAGQGGRLQNLPGGYVGGFVGDATSPGHIQRQLIAGGQVLGRYGDAPDSLKTQASGGQVPQYAHTAEFELKAPSLSRESINTEPQRYSASGGESLRDIARNLLGDANLWWRIADANALAISADAPLVAGQSLLIPSQALNANSSETLRSLCTNQAVSERCGSGWAARRKTQQ
ncbi:MAG: hypothetical protein HEQ37_14125 [Acidovorax sp.]|nr:hypothetical protein [Acidovorax sp.]